MHHQEIIHSHGSLKLSSYPLRSIIELKKIKAMEKTLASSPFITLKENDGYFYCESPPFVTIVAHRGSSILLVKQKRPFFNKPIWGLPGGRMEKGEKPQQAAKREFLEETGYHAKKIVVAKTITPSTSLLKAEGYMCIAYGLTKKYKTAPDAAEIINSSWVNWIDALPLIHDSVSLAAILVWRQRRQRE